MSGEAVPSDADSNVSLAGSAVSNQIGSSGDVSLESMGEVAEWHSKVANPVEDSRLRAVRVKLECLDNSVLALQKKLECDRIRLDRKNSYLLHAKESLNNLICQETNLRVQYFVPSEGGPSQSGRVPFSAAKERRLNSMQMKEKRLESNILTATNSITMIEERIRKHLVALELKSAQRKQLISRIRDLLAAIEKKAEKQSELEKLRAERSEQQRLKKEAKAKAQRLKAAKAARKANDTVKSKSIVQFFSVANLETEADIEPTNFDTLLKNYAASGECTSEVLKGEHLLELIKSQSTPVDKLYDDEVRSGTVCPKNILPSIKSQLTDGHYEQLLCIKEPVAVKRLIRHMGSAYFFYGPVKRRSDMVTFREPFVQDKDALNYDEEMNEECNVSAHESIDLTDDDETSDSEASNLSFFEAEEVKRASIVESDGYPSYWGLIYNQAPGSTDAMDDIKRFTAIVVNHAEAVNVHEE